MTLYRRGRTWHVAYRITGRLVRRTLGTDDKTVANMVLADLKQTMTAGRVHEAKRRILADFGLESPEIDAPRSTESNDHGSGHMTTLPRKVVPLGEAWNKYLAWAKVNLRPGTVEQASISWTLLLEYAKPVSLSAITPEVLERFKAHLMREHAAKTVNNKLGDVKAVMNRMIALRLMSGPNPAVGVQRMKLSKTPPKFLTPKQADALMTAARSHSEDMLLFVSLCLLAGLRKGEAIAARWEWVDIKAKTLTVQAGHGFTPKDSDCRTVPVSDRLGKILRQYSRNAQGIHSHPIRGVCVAPGYVVSSAVSWRPGTRYRIEVRDGFEAVCKAAGLEWVTPHVLRHSFASALVQSGVSLYKVQQWLGHSDAATTQIYAHLAAYDKDVNGKHG